MRRTLNELLAPPIPPQEPAQAVRQRAESEKPREKESPALLAQDAQSDMGDSPAQLELDDL